MPIDTDDLDRRSLLRLGALAPALGLMPWLAHAQAETPRRGGVFRYAQLFANVSGSDPQNARHPYHMVDSFTRSQFNALTWVNEKLELEMELAREVVPTDDKLNVWEASLREGVMFHNGKELGAEDVVASFIYHKEKNGFSRQITKVEALGKYKVRFTLEAGNSEFPFVLAEYNNVIMQADTPDKIGLSGIGTGPFKIISTDANRSMIMQRNEAYWKRGMPYLDGLEIHNRQGQEEAALNGLRANLFDMVTYIDARAVRQFENDPNYEVSVGVGSYHWVIQMPKNPGSPFEDKRIRQAFALAIDREALQRVVYGVRSGWIGNESHLVVNDPAFLPLTVKRDVAKARRLLAEAGHPNGITLPTLYWSPQLPEAGRYFQVLQQSVKEAGITVQLEERPNAGYLAFRTGDNDMSKGSFHKFAMTSVGARNPGISLFRMRGANVESGYWRGPAHDRYMQLYGQAMVTRDPGQRRALYHEMQRILQEEVPAVLPGGGNLHLLMRKTVKGLRAHPQGWSHRFESVWLSA